MPMESMKYLQSSEKSVGWILILDHGCSRANVQLGNSRSSSHRCLQITDADWTGNNVEQHIYQIPGVVKVWQKTSDVTGVYLNESFEL